MFTRREPLEGLGVGGGSVLGLWEEIFGCVIFGFERRVGFFPWVFYIILILLRHPQQRDVRHTQFQNRALEIPSSEGPIPVMTSDTADNRAYRGR